MHTCLSLPFILCSQQCLFPPVSLSVLAPNLTHAGAHELCAEMVWSRGDRGRGPSGVGAAHYLVEYFQLFLLVPRVPDFIFEV